MRVDWLDQMVFEPGFHAALDIFLHSESANSNAAEALRLPGCTHQLIATPVGQTDVGDKDVKRFTIEQFSCVRHAGGGANAEPILSKNGRKHAQGIGMVFHQRVHADRLAALP